MGIMKEPLWKMDKIQISFTYQKCVEILFYFKHFIFKNILYFYLKTYKNYINFLLFLKNYFNTF